MRLLAAFAGILVTTKLVAAPAGFVKTTIPLDAPPVGLAFDAAGVLYALEAATMNAATLHVIHPDGSNSSFSVFGDDPSNFYVGAMAYDALGNRLLVTDNTADGRLYAISPSGTAQETLAMGIAGIAGVAVRSTGEIFITTAPFGSAGAVLQLDRANYQTTEVLGGLALGAGLAFDTTGSLIVQDASLVLPTYELNGRLQKLPIDGDASGLHFGLAELLLDNMHSSYAVAVDGANNIYATGSGGLYQVGGSPLVETLLAPSQFSAAATLLPGTRPFQAFAGPDGGKLAYAAEAYWGNEDMFVTLLTPAEPGDFNSDGHVDALDYPVWRGAFGSDDPAADSNRDGRVDAADYVLWREHLSPSAAATSAGASVPEPAIGVTLIVACVFGGLRSRGSLRNGTR